jgi:hypothetical protein
VTVADGERKAELAIRRVDHGRTLPAPADGVDGWSGCGKVAIR